MKVLTRFVTSAANPKQFPASGAPEIAFLGRSNVGKSSLINALVASKIAKTSNTPGRTQTINFFEVRRPGKPHPEMIFVDLPGYGYARVSKKFERDATSKRAGSNPGPKCFQATCVRTGSAEQVGCCGVHR